jgi:antitoxin HigA-1
MPSTTKTITEGAVAMRMHNPPHPGEIIKTLCLEPLGVSVTQAAEALGVSRKTLSAIVNGRAGISPEMAIRLSIAFGTSAESWLNQQTQYDLWQAEQHCQAGASVEDAQLAFWPLSAAFRRGGPRSGPRPASRRPRRSGRAR